MAWQFDGQDDYAALADAPALTCPDGPWTVAGWVLRTDNAGASYQYLASWGNYSEESSFNWRIGETDVPTVNRRPHACTHPPIHRLQGPRLARGCERRR